jgi:aminoglycoside phosphotransferase (APT) family kinase protein
MHHGELHIVDAVVVQLIASQAPEWSGLPLERVESAGTGNVMYRLGSNRLVRLPRLAVHADRPRCEFEVLGRVRGLVSCGTPDPLFLGRPADVYPASWTVVEWIEGGRSTSGDLGASAIAARRLGEVVMSICGLSPEGGPTDQIRGRSCRTAEEFFRSSVAELPGRYDRAAIRDLWERCTNAASPSQLGTWLHGDLHGANLLWENDDLVAAID